MDERTLICVDVGNSRTKVAVSQQGLTGWSSLQAVASPEQLELPKERAADWVAVSVNHPRLGTLRQWIEQNRRGDCLFILDRSDFPLNLAVEHPERLGLDRLAAAYGAVQVASRTGFPLIVVNVGTAVTIDLLNGAGTFLGGVIYPGPFTCFQALSRATDQLPELYVDRIPEMAWGRNTADAISCGIWQMQIGAIRQIVSRYQRELSDGRHPWGGEVFLTGGGSAPLESAFQSEFRIVPDLVLQGVRAAARRREVS